MVKELDGSEYDKTLHSKVDSTSPVRFHVYKIRQQLKQSDEDLSTIEKQLWVLFTFPPSTGLADNGIELGKALSALYTSLEEAILILIKDCYGDAKSREVIHQARAVLDRIASLSKLTSLIAKHHGATPISTD
jgi:hypothetical protein